MRCGDCRHASRLSCGVLRCHVLYVQAVAGRLRRGWRYAAAAEGAGESMRYPWQECDAMPEMNPNGRTTWTMAERVAAVRDCLEVVRWPIFDLDAVVEVVREVEGEQRRVGQRGMVYKVTRDTVGLLFCDGTTSIHNIENVRVIP